jgi:hypothetical protein
VVNRQNFDFTGVSCQRSMAVTVNRPARSTFFINRRHDLIIETVDSVSRV